MTATSLYSLTHSQSFYSDGQIDDVKETTQAIIDATSYPL
jgi:hypothetical protein